MKWNRSSLAILLIALIFFGINDVNKRWRKEALLRYDAAIYYTYLPAFFIYQDPGLSYIDSFPEYRKAHKKAHFETLPNGKRYIKTTMGLAYMHLPFFLLGHWKAGWEGKPQDGYSPPYENMLLYGAFFYVILALILLAKVLSAWFSDKVTALTLITVVLGTNLLYYSTLEGLHVHAYNFSLFSFFLYGVYRYFQKPALWKALILGLLLGLITLIRPTNILLGLLIPLYGVKNWKDLKERFLFFWKNVPAVLTFIVAFFIVWIPQMWYWHDVSGQWFFFSYGEKERFFWMDPKFLYGFFSYRKGLFIYTPVMALAFFGLFFLRKYAAEFFWAILLFVPLNFYVIFSWWSWWYGGCYGMRPAIDSFPLMAIATGAFFSWLYSRKRWMKTVVMIAWGALILLNLFQTWQYYKGILHWDSMTQKAYWAVFLKTEKPENYESLLQVPSNEKASDGIDEYGGR